MAIVRHRLSCEVLEHSCWRSSLSVELPLSAVEASHEVVLIACSLSRSTGWRFVGQLQLYLSLTPSAYVIIATSPATSPSVVPVPGCMSVLEGCKYREDYTNEYD